MKYEYIACINKIKNVGVYNKLKHICLSLESNGNDVKLTIVSDFGLKKHIKMVYLILITNANIIILRNTNSSMSIYCLALLIKRILGVKIIIDIPTPLHAVVHELSSFKESNIKKIFKKILLYFVFPYSLLTANRVLQYAEESKYFSLLLKHKIKLTSNGIKTDSIDLRTKIPIINSEIILIGVGNLATWHGYDRIIRSIATFMSYENSKKTKISFYIIGEGNSKIMLENIAENLKVKDNVIFYGSQTGPTLSRLFQKAHVAVSSLALFRNKLKRASVLKSREYTARGIPFIAVNGDIDFDPSPDFIYQIDNNNSEIDISDLINWYENLNYTPKNIRKYSEDILDYKNKKDDFLF